MALSLLSHEVSDLCLGKPGLRCLSLATATVADALYALKFTDDNFVSIWSCNHGGLSFNNNNNHAQKKNNEHGEDICQCVGKVSMADVIVYLCKDDNLVSPLNGLKAPVSVLLTQIPAPVMMAQPCSSLLEAIDMILEGAYNLVVPIQTRQLTRRKLQQKSLPNSPTVHNGSEFCWLTQQDVIRFLLSSIGLFSPLPAISIDTLNIITTDVITVDYHSPASDALPAIAASLSDQTSVAVVDSENCLIGEISPFTLACCDETVAAAITTLSTGDLMAYIDCGSPPEDLIKLVKERLKDRNLMAMLDQFNDSLNSFPLMSSSSSSDEECFNSPSGPRSLRHSRSMSYSARMRTLRRHGLRDGRPRISAHRNISSSMLFPNSFYARLGIVILIAHEAVCASRQGSIRINVRIFAFNSRGQFNLKWSKAGAK
ncbi:hypothetical protein ACFE04_023563 [Oxalis oulophora]